MSKLFIEFGVIELTRHNLSRCDERRLLPPKKDKVSEETKTRRITQPIKKTKKAQILMLKFPN